MGFLVIVVFWYCTFFTGYGGRQNMSNLIFVCFHSKLMFWTYVLEKYDMFLNLNTRRTSDLNQDRLIHKRMVAAHNCCIEPSATGI